MPLQNMVLAVISEAPNGTIQKIYQTDYNELVLMYHPLADGGYSIGVLCYNRADNQLLWKISNLTPKDNPNIRLEFGTLDLAEAWGDYIIKILSENTDRINYISFVLAFDDYGAIRRPRRPFGPLTLGA